MNRGLYKYLHSCFTGSRLPVSRASKHIKKIYKGPARGFVRRTRDDTSVYEVPPTGQLPRGWPMRGIILWTGLALGLSVQLLGLQVGFRLCASTEGWM